MAFVAAFGLYAFFLCNQGWLTASDEKNLTNGIILLEIDIDQGACISIVNALEL